MAELHSQGKVFIFCGAKNQEENIAWWLQNLTSCLSKVALGFLRHIRCDVKDLGCPDRHKNRVKITNRICHSSSSFATWLHLLNCLCDGHICLSFPHTISALQQNRFPFATDIERLSTQDHHQGKKQAFDWSEDGKGALVYNATALQGFNNVCLSAVEQRRDKPDCWQQHLHQSSWSPGIHLCWSLWVWTALVAGMLELLLLPGIPASTVHFLEDQVLPAKAIENFSARIQDHTYHPKSWQ